MEFEAIKLINEPTTAEIFYEHRWKSNKDVLIFDLHKRTFDVSIVKFKGKDYYILVSINEDHLEDDDFTQRIFE